ncbi:MAG: hypothetical protein M1829_000435 [Trizodia sp. TS-e1964]|nr:MAG: hypothetical protein M1829_000435 [Trizodia sp. TS-e1964]
MPTRVAAQPQLSNGFAFGAQSRTSNSSRADDSGSGAEGRARKRFHRTAPEADAGAKPPNAIISSLKNAKEPRSSFASRRKSTREQSIPLGPRPPDLSPAKPSSERAYAPDPQISQDQKSSFSRGDSLSVPDSRQKNDDTPGSLDFLPSFSFDELHASITATDPTLSQFPAPGRGGVGLAGEDRRIMNGGHDINEKAAGNGAGVIGGAGGPRFGRSGSILRRQSITTRQSSAGSIATAEIQTASLAIRPRRQSNFPPVSAHNIVSRPPRKSIGPGGLETELAGRGMHRRKASLVSSISNPLGLEGVPLSSTSSRVSISGGLAAAVVESPKSLANSRMLKAKSLQPAPRPRQGLLSSPAATPDYNCSSSIAASRSPKSPGRREGTPSSTNKRLSMMPHHATGLGARTISPTDAQRMKRLSRLHDTPPMPMTPPTPQPDLVPGVRSASQSPMVLPRSSGTPSSSRTTPEQNRKSYSSGISISSNTSYNSHRTSNGSLQPRLSQSISTSRLPTPKPRNVHSSAAVDEEVPPVPAIPKAYESPKESPYDLLFPVNTRKASYPFDANSSIASASTAEYFPSTAGHKESRHHKRVLATSTGSDVESTTVTTTASKKSLQPLRLPPLNLLPLSTPTAARVAALQEPTIDGDTGRGTPAARINVKTPSTPLTASKANFFSRSRQDEESVNFGFHLRSSSSNHQIRAETASLRAGSSSSSNMPASATMPPARQAISPYISTSLPKNGGEFGSLRSEPSGEYHNASIGMDLRPTRLNGPRAQTSAKTAKEEQYIPPMSPYEPDTPSSTSSLRRKLSLGWKRTASKSSLSSQAAEYPPQPPKHDNMPPPKYPASATWNGQSVTSPSPSLKSLNQFDSKRRKSSASSLIGGHTRQASDSWNDGSSIRSPKKASSSSIDIPDPIPTSLPRSATSIMHKMLNPKSSFNQLKARNLDPNLDREDLMAEEEMRKLASKRKDFETAARQADELRRRATPKERASPSQALRIAKLNIFERGEIVDYKEIYFCGTSTVKKHVGDLNSQSLANFGYDDERGDYTIIEGDHLSYRYEIVDILGKGSFGQVVRCIDHKTGGLVAVKIIRNKKRFHQQALVEVNILKKLREWDPQNKHSMVSFTQSFYFRGHLCISTELLGMNLYEFIKSNDFRGFSLKLIKRFTKQLLSSLLLLKSHRVIHCDLKPENVLLAHPAHSEIKVIDFGSSCFENEKVYTYIQSRFYRSPEVILGMTYGMPIDMWSLGCILAELYTGYPIFPGENEQEQLACIMEVFGPPEKHLIEKSTRKKLFFDSMGKPRLTVSSKGRRRRPSSKTLQQALKCDDEAFIDFLTRCLRWDPERRLKPDEAVNHEFLTGVRKPLKSRPQHLGSESPIKRSTTFSTPSVSRPLPEPPATSFKNGAAVRSRDPPSSSPSKVSINKRQSNALNHLQPSIGSKRTSTGAAIGSGLPRVATRTGAVRMELAPVAAASEMLTTPR